MDSDTGLYHFGARDYDPFTARWTAKDPILFVGGETGLYDYTGNDPVYFIDPSGRDSLMPYGAPGSSAGMVQAAEAQAAAQQAQVNRVEQLANAARCSGRQFRKEYAVNATWLQQQLGPVETVSSIDGALQAASNDAAGSTADTTWEQGGARSSAGGTFAAKVVSSLHAGAKVAGDVSDGGLALGSGLDVGDALYSAFEVTSGADGMCCP